MSSVSDTEIDFGLVSPLQDDTSIFDPLDRGKDDDGDLEAARKDEFDSLKAIYLDDDIKFKEWDGRLGFKICFGKMKLEIVTDKTYPHEAPLHLSVTGISVPDAINITASLTDLAETKRGSFQLFDLIEESRTMLNALQNDSTVEEDETIDSFCNVKFPHFSDAEPFMAGITLEMIARRLADTNVKILHSELVLNPCLVSRFEKMSNFLSQEKYARVKKVDYASIEVCFHGTQRKFIPNIISRGFVKPGDVMNDNGDILQIRCGSSYGQGIYTSPDPRYSMSYSDYSEGDFGRLPGEKLIVCGILRGRPYTFNEFNRKCTSPYDDFDSHVSPSGFEYVVFNSAQLLPLYVLHVSSGDPNLSSFWARRVQQGPPVSLRAGFNAIESRNRTGIEEIDQSDADLTLSMKRKILTRIARKHFPLGFGPATGDKFMVEEIGAVDEAEEDWGEYQLDRKGYKRDGRGISYEEVEEDETQYPGHNLRDEFQKARFKY